jgi:peptide/nickel transport system substrate-binding protein
MRCLTRRQFIYRVTSLVSVLDLAGCAPIAPSTPTQGAPQVPSSTAPAAKAPATAAPAATAAAAKPAATPSGPPATSAAPAPAAAQPKRGGRLTVGQNYDVVNFDPAGINSTQFEIFDQIFGTLTRLDENLKPQPELAESWELSSDHKRIQLKLRGGATFHSGKEVTAEDVVATIFRYQDEKTGANIRPQLVQFKDPKAIDMRTVEISFDAPTANLFDALDLMFIWDKDNFADLKQKPNGTGPFKLEEWRPGDSVRLVRHEGYYKSGLPHLDEVVLKVYPDHEALLIALEAGAVDVTSRLRGMDKPRLEQHKDLRVATSKPGVTIFTIALGTQRPPLTDRRVRQAISYAINRQRFVDTFLAGLGEPWSLPWPPHSPAYDPVGNTAHNQNVERSKQLLAEAGLPDGFETTTMTNRTRAGLAELSELVQNDLAQVGIRAKISVLEEATWQPRYRDGDFDIAPNSTGRTSKHPSSLFSLNVNFGAERNNEKFSHDEYKRLAALSLSTLDPAKAKEVYDGLNKIILEEAFNPVIAPQTNLWGLRNYVQGYQWSLDDWDIMEGAWLDK